jgi:hypothetical protein
MALLLIGKSPSQGEAYQRWRVSVFRTNFLYGSQSVTIQLVSGPTVLGGFVAGPAIDLSDSLWQVRYQKPGAPSQDTITLYFAAGGIVHPMFSKGPGRAFGHWQQQHNRVTFNINNFSIWEGTISTGGMSGTARASTTQWDWKAIPKR